MLVESMTLRDRRSVFTVTGADRGSAQVAGVGAGHVHCWPCQRFDVRPVRDRRWFPAVVRARHAVAGRKHGARVAVAEADRWGGTCVIRGCVPKKAAGVRQRGQPHTRGWPGGPGPGRSRRPGHDWAALIAAKDKEIARAYRTHMRRRLRKAGAEVIAGPGAAGRSSYDRGRRSDDDRGEHPDRHRAGGRRAARAATGSTSDEAFHLTELPRRIAIMGGGYIAIEFAHIFAGLGAKVRLESIRDEAGAARLRPPMSRKAGPPRNLSAHGIDFLCCHELVRRGGHIVVGNRENRRRRRGWARDRPRIRRPAELGLGEAGVRARRARGRDHRRRVVGGPAAPHIYAVGDVTGPGRADPGGDPRGATRWPTRCFGNRPTPIHHHQPDPDRGVRPAGRAAAVGVHRAGGARPGRPRGRGVSAPRFRPMRYALSGRDEQILIKVIVDRMTDRVLGVHMVGVERAPRSSRPSAIAVTMGRGPRPTLDRTFALAPDHQRGAGAAALTRGPPPEVGPITTGDRDSRDSQTGDAP